MQLSDLILLKAERFLAAGRPLPLDLVAALIEAGFDVNALEQRYRQ